MTRPLFPAAHFEEPVPKVPGQIDMFTEDDNDETRQEEHDDASTDH
jgi:hypothetical protein